MNWFVAALVSAVALSGQALMFQRLQKHYPVTTYVTYVWFGAALLIGLIFVRPSDFAAVMANSIPLILAGLTSFFGIFAYTQSIKLQSNIGYIEAIVAIRTAITYVFSLMVFNAPFELVKLIGVIGVTLGVLAVAEAFPIKRENKIVAMPLPQTANKSALQFGWLIWAFIAAAMFTLLTIFVRLATDNGARAEVSLVVVLIVAGLLFFTWGVTEKRSFVIARPHIILIVAAIAFATIGNVADFISFQKAPNLAYAVAVSNTRMIILYILGMVLFAEKLQSIKAIGIILTFIGVIILS
jgi:uncharacterized membrane protein